MSVVVVGRCDVRGRDFLITEQPPLVDGPWWSWHASSVFLVARYTPTSFVVLNISGIATQKNQIPPAHDGRRRQRVIQNPCRRRRRRSSRLSDLLYGAVRHRR